MMLLRFLQHNAEWICAIAITCFAAVQCWLAHQQNLQNVKIKRLELANKLDAICCKFRGEKSQASEILNWLIENASNFVFLLNAKDRTSYKELISFIMNYKNNSTTYSASEKIEALTKFNNILGKLDIALGNANYGFINEKNEL